MQPKNSYIWDLVYADVDFLSSFHFFLVKEQSLENLMCISKTAFLLLKGVKIWIKCTIQRIWLMLQSRWLKALRLWRFKWFRQFRRQKSFLGCNYKNCFCKNKIDYGSFEVKGYKVCYTKVPSRQIILFHCSESLVVNGFFYHCFIRLNLLLLEFEWLCICSSLLVTKT